MPLQRASPSTLYPIDHTRLLVVHHLSLRTTRYDQSVFLPTQLLPPSFVSLRSSLGLPHTTETTPLAIPHTQQAGLSLHTHSPADFLKRMSTHPPAEFYSPSCPETALSSLLPDQSHRSLLLEGLDNFEIQVYNGVRPLAIKLKIQADGLVAGGSNQFAVFCPVTRSQFSTLSKERYQIGRYTRIMYSEEERIMIVKLMPAAGHQVAYTTFVRRLT